MKIDLGYDATYNDPALTKRVAAALRLGLRRVARRGGSAGHGRRRTSATSAGPRSARRSCSGSGALARPGSSRPRTGDMTKLPSLHSSEWAPDREPTLKTGAAALTVAALELLGKP